jgi:hypothetical protein
MLGDRSGAAVCSLEEVAMPHEMKAAERSMVVSAGPETRLGVRSQLILSSYWSSLSFHGGAVFSVAVAEQILDLVPDREKTTALALIGGLVLAALSPYGTATSYGVLFLGAALCAALSGVYVWRVRSVR